MLQAGFARVDITPPVGSEVPGGFAKNFSQGVHDPLWVEAAVIRNGATALALVGVDLIMLPGDVVTKARAEAEARCGIPGSHIMMGASHTHNAGPVVDCFECESDPDYCDRAAHAIADAVVAASERAVAARVGSGVGHEDSVAFNRRFRMKDGTIRTHPGKLNPDIIEPAGPIDPAVGVIGVADDQGELLGCIVNYTCHGTTLGGSVTSADWIYYLRNTIRGAYGDDVGVVFLNGACGDVTQVDNRDGRPAEFGEAWARRVGATVGAEAVKVLVRMDFTNDVPLAAASELVPLPIRDLGATDEELLRRESPGYGLGSGDFQERIYANEVRLVREMRNQSPTVPGEVQVFRIGPVGIASNTCEFFCQLGLDIKARSPLKPTFVVELANGCHGYCPTPDAFTGGGYETRTARSSYLAPEAGPAIVDAAVRQLTCVAAP